MHITFFDQGQWLRLSTVGSLSSESLGETPLPARGDSTAAATWMQRWFADSSAQARLRDLLASDLYDSVRRSDAEVVAEAASRLARGAWSVSLEPRPATTGMAKVDVADVPVAAAQRQPYTPSPAAPAPTKRAVAPEPQQAPAPVASEWSQAADQVAQAQTLVKAAENGTPFCEVCAAKAKARAQALEEQAEQ